MKPKPCNSKPKTKTKPLDSFESLPSPASPQDLSLEDEDALILWLRQKSQIEVLALVQKPKLQMINDARVRVCNAGFSLSPISAQNLKPSKSFSALTIPIREINCLSAVNSRNKWNSSTKNPCYSTKNTLSAAIPQHQKTDSDLAPASNYTPLPAIPLISEISTQPATPSHPVGIGAYSSFWIVNELSKVTHDTLGYWE